MRKMIHIATASHDALQMLASEQGLTFQELVDEAFSDLLKKHKRPVTLKQMLSDSVAASQKQPAPPRAGKSRRRAS